MKETIINYFIKWLEQEAIKIAIANLIKKPFMADFRAWLIKFAVDYLAEHIVRPAIEYFFRKAGYQYEVVKGKHILKEIQNAGNIGDWNEATNKV